MSLIRPSGTIGPKDYKCLPEPHEADADEASREREDSILAEASARAALDGVVRQFKRFVRAATPAQAKQERLTPEQWNVLWNANGISLDRAKNRVVSGIEAVVARHGGYDEPGTRESFAEYYNEELPKKGDTASLKEFEAFAILRQTSHMEKQYRAGERTIFVREEDVWEKFKRLIKLRGAPGKDPEPLDDDEWLYLFESESIQDQRTQRALRWYFQSPRFLEDAFQWLMTLSDSQRNSYVVSEPLECYVVSIMANCREEGKAIEYLERLQSMMHSGSSPGKQMELPLIALVTGGRSDSVHNRVTGYRWSKQQSEEHGSSVPNKEETIAAAQAAKAETSNRAKLPPIRRGKKSLPAFVPPERAEAFKAIAAAKGMGVTQYLEHLIDEHVEANANLISVGRDKLKGPRRYRSRAVELEQENRQLKELLRRSGLKPT